MMRPLKLLDTLRAWARRVKRDAMALWFARRHPQTPWHAKALAVFVVAYALSPIDLIPDFIPVLGYIDDLVILPLGILLVVRLVGPQLMAQFRAEVALAAGARRPASRLGLAIVIGLWLAAVLVIGWAWWR